MLLRPSRSRSPSWTLSRDESRGLYDLRDGSRRLCDLRDDSLRLVPSGLDTLDPSERRWRGEIGLGSSMRAFLSRSRPSGRSATPLVRDSRRQSSARLSSSRSRLRAASASARRSALLWSSTLRIMLERKRLLVTRTGLGAERHQHQPARPCQTRLSC